MADNRREKETKITASKINLDVILCTDDSPEGQLDLQFIFLFLIDQFDFSARIQMFCSRIEKRISILCIKYQKQSKSVL